MDGGLSVSSNLSYYISLVNHLKDHKIHNIFTNNNDFNINMTFYGLLNEIRFLKRLDHFF